MNSRKWITFLLILCLSVAVTSVAAQGQDVGDNPDAYFGEIITVEGVANIVSPNAFELVQTQPFDLAPESILVFPNTEDFGIDINNGMRLQVTGTFEQYDLLTMETNLGMDLDDNALAGYDAADYVITATTVTPIQQVDGQVDGVTNNRMLMDETTAADFETNTETYFNQNITIEGVANIVSANVFELTQTQPFDLTPDSILVFPGTGDDFNIDINNGLRVRVTGTFNQYDEANMNSVLGFELDTDALSNYDNADYALTATSVTRLSDMNYADAATTLDDVTDNPSDYYGQTVNVAGYIDEDVNLVTGNFVIRDDDLLGTERALVLSTSDAQPMAADTANTTMEAFSVDNRVIVNGTVRPFVVADLESELGYELDDNLYVNYETLPVIVATSVEHAAESDALDADMANEGLGTANEGVGVFDPANYNDYPVDPNASLDDVTDDPTPYYGQVVNVNGTVSGLTEVNRGFYLWDDDLLFADRALVLGGNQQHWDAINTLDVDSGVAVRGVVRPMIITDLESEIGYDLDDALYTDFAADELAVIVALEIIPNVQQ